MDKDASLFSSLSEYEEHNISMDNDYSLTISRFGNVKCQHGVISNVYHVPSLSEKLLSITQLTQIDKSIEFWLDQFIVKDLKHGE